MLLDAILNGVSDFRTLLIPEHIKNAPSVIRKSIAALKKLHSKTVQIETELNKKIYELRVEFEKQFAEINEKRGVIVSGTHEPSENEYDSEFNDEKSDQNESPKGIPDFWLNVLLNAPSVCGIIQEHDKPILQYLRNVSVEEINEPMAFAINFHFEENPHFNNSVLTKQFEILIGPTEHGDKASQKGVNVVATKGCRISWKHGKDVTEINGDSFFSFLSSEIREIENEEEEPDGYFEMLDFEYEIGQSLRDVVTKTAVLCYMQVLDGYSGNKGS